MLDIDNQLQGLSLLSATTISAVHSGVDPEVKEYKGEHFEKGLGKKYYFHVTTRNSDGSPVTQGGAFLVSAILPSSDDKGMSHNFCYFTKSTA